MHRPIKNSLRFHALILPQLCAMYSLHMQTNNMVQPAAIYLIIRLRPEMRATARNMVFTLASPFLMAAWAPK